MRAGTKVGGFLAGLVAVGVVGAGVGALAGPIDTEPADHETAEHDAPSGGASEPGSEHGGTGHEGTGSEGDMDPAATDPATDEAGGHEGHEEAPADAEGAEAALGTSATQSGYRLALDPTDTEIRLQVLDPDGEPVVDTEVLHERPLHLIVVGRDLVGYAHVHPEVGADGTWTVARPPLAPGSYRVVADLKPVDGPELALAGDLTVPGEIVSRGGVPEPGNPTTVDDLTVTFDGHPQVGDTELAFTVTRAGEAVEPEPYLGARGHLVAFRGDDLAYSHVHPGDETDGPVRFTASFPTPGLYRLFLDLQVDGEVRTFGFTVEVDDHEH